MLAGNTRTIRRKKTGASGELVRIEQAGVHTDDMPCPCSVYSSCKRLCLVLPFLRTIARINLPCRQPQYPAIKPSRPQEITLAAAASKETHRSPRTSGLPSLTGTPGGDAGEPTSPPAWGCSALRRSRAICSARTSACISCVYSARDSNTLFCSLPSASNERRSFSACRSRLRSKHNSRNISVTANRHSWAIGAGLLERLEVSTRNSHGRCLCSKMATASRTACICIWSENTVHMHVITPIKFRVLLA